MPETGAAHQPRPADDWVSRLVAAEPRLPLLGPYMVYLVLMFFVGYAGQNDPARHVGIVLHMAGAGWACWLMRRFWPPMGKAHLPLAIVVGLAAAAMWVAGQHWLETISVGDANLGGRLTFNLSFPFAHLEAIDPAKITNPTTEFAPGRSFWTHVILKITRAVTVVPIVEELFWRGFILRAFIHWDRFETVPLGRFTWFSFLGSSFLSTIQHPANWGVSILCWMLFNALFYWTRSLWCLIATHAVTNLALYVYVVRSGDWQFW